MHKRQPPPRALLELADLQAGAITREQARAHGLSDDVLQRLSRSLWRRIAPGIYFTANSAPTWPTLAWAGVLAGGDRARLGPASSGWLYGLSGEPPTPIDVLVPHGRGGESDGPWHFIRERSGVRLARTVGTPPRLVAEDTVLDLAAAATDEAEIISLLARAAQRRMTTPARLLKVLAGRARQPHRALLRAALGDVGLGAESVLEVRYLRDVERAHGLPTGGRQRRIRRRGYRTDVEYQLYVLIVELDGMLFHDGEGRFRDLDRDNVHVLLGRVTLRYGWFDVVSRPCRIAAQVARQLRARGWMGQPTRCPRCRRLTDEEWADSWGVVD